MFRTRIHVVLAVVSLSSVPAHAANSYTVTSGEVTVVCALTVGGTFEAKTTSISGELASPHDKPGVIDGVLRVDLQSLETGIWLRDRHLRNNYLEVQRGPSYAVALLENIRVDKTDGKGAFRALLTVHGQRKEIAGSVGRHRRAGGLHVEATFPLRVSDFEIAEPAYLGVGVKDEIQVKVSFIATRSLTTH
jgi:polyisoprenoid-binding protein YceI